MPCCFFCFVTQTINYMTETKAGVHTILYFEILKKTTIIIMFCCSSVQFQKTLQEIGEPKLLF